MARWLMTPTILTLKVRRGNILRMIGKRDARKRVQFPPCL